MPRQMNPRRIVLTLSVLLFAAFVLISAVLTFFVYAYYYGTCPHSHITLTHEQKIDAAIGRIISRRLAVVYTENGTQEYQIQQYTSIESFKTSNPDCCSLDPANSIESFLIRFGLARPTQAHISYVETYLDEQKNTHNRVVTIEDSINSCGILDHQPR